jgi:regulator of replication initiation timing
MHKSELFDHAQKLEEEITRLTKQRDELQRDYDRLAEALETEKRYTARLGELEEKLTAARNALLNEGMQRDELAEAFTVLWVSQGYGERSHWDSTTIARFDTLLASLEEMK